MYRNLKYFFNIHHHTHFEFKPSFSKVHYGPHNCIPHEVLARNHLKATLFGSIYCHSI